VTAAGVEAREEELCLGSMTAVVCEQDDEQVGWKEKEMTGDPSVTSEWVAVSRLKDSARLSEEKAHTQKNSPQ